MKLHQLLALLPSIKATATKLKTELYQAVQKPALFKGLSRTYAPREEEGFVYPPESVAVQMHAIKSLEEFTAACTELFNLAAAQDETNRTASADIVVNGVTFAANVPVTNLLFLEKQLTDLKTFIGNLPLLDVDKSWTFDNARGCYVTNPRNSVKTKKITKPVVLYEATKEHPAQVKEASEDIVEGTWTAIDISGCLSKEESIKYLKRVDNLIRAVVLAREEANSIEVKKLDLAASLFDYILN